jgi:hypothetical protein
MNRDTTYNWDTLVVKGDVANQALEEVCKSWYSLYSLVRFSA